MRLLLLPLLGSVIAAAALLLCALPTNARASQEGAVWRRPASITVVSDDNYPPYIFRTDEGRVQGILVDQWKAWEQATGVSVNLVAMDWESAQKYMQAGHADVIDTLFYSDARARIYDFTKPYASLDVPVFFHKSLGGITDAQSLRGFTVGVKAGDAVIEVLGRYGINSLKQYDSYQDIIDAARAGDIRVFSMDGPPALYYLYKHNLEAEFRQAFVLYSGAFHRAVRKGDRELLQFVEQGFAAIPDGVRQGIDEKWLGTPIANLRNLRLAVYFAGGVAVLVLALGFFNIILRRRVRAKTAELEDTLGRLRTSEERFRTIFNSVSDLIFIHSWPDGRIVDVNQRTCDVFGYTREEMQKLPVEATSDGTAPYDQASAMDLMRKAYEGEPQMVEWRARRRDGGLFWLEVSIRRALVLGREQILVSCRDISDRKMAEEALKASENTLRSLFASMTDTILILDAQGRYLEVAPTTADRLYRPPPELLGKTVSEIFAPDKAGYFLDVIRQSLSAGITVSTDYNLVIGDREYWFAGNVSPLSADRVLWVARDITERKKAEEALYDSRERLQLALDAANDGLWDWRLDTGEMYFSPRYYTMLGYDPGEFPADLENFTNLVHPDDLANLNQSIASSLHGSETNSQELRMRAKSGEWKWVLTRSRVVDRDAAGAPTRFAGTHTDITERKRAEEALLASERRFSELIRNSFDSITILDRLGVQVFVSDAVERMLGFKPWELVDIPVVEDMIHPDDQERVKQTFAAILREGMGGAQYRHRHKNGSWVQLEAWGTNQLDNPDIRGIVVNVRDITERKTTEETLARKDALLQAMLRNLPFDFWARDCERRMIMQSDESIRLWGDLRANPQLEENIAPENLAVWEATNKRVLAGEVVAGEHEFLTPHGQRLTFHDIVAPIRDGEAVLGILGVNIDITERRGIEQALRESEERYRTIFERSMDAMAIQEGLPPVFTWVNPAFCELFGYAPEEVYAFKVEDIWQLVHPEDRALVRESLTARLSGRLDDVRYGFRIVRKDGTVRWVDVSGRGLRKGASSMNLSIYRDITERKMFEQALTDARDAADAASRAKSEFLANMSHEIRTPLNGIVGMIQLLADSPLDAEQKGYAQAAIQSSQRLTSLLGDILDLSRIEARKLVLEHKPFVLADILESVEALYLLPARQKGIELNLRLDPELPRWLVGDELRLRQVLFNLVGNAVKFTHQGNILVEVERLGQPSPAQCRVLFAVSDTGVGIPPGLLVQSFQIFTQVEGSLTRSHQGAGLGLAIVRHLVGLLGGQAIDVSSEVGVGSTFSFALSFALPTGQALEDLNRTEAQPGGQKAGLAPGLTDGQKAELTGLDVLLVEDEEINQLALRTCLERQGQRVTCAGSGEEALALLRKGRQYQCILLDIQMPGMSGLEVAQAIRTRPEYSSCADIPIIALTACAMFGDRERFLAAGMDDYLPKPFAFEDLLRILARVVGRGPDRHSGLAKDAGRGQSA